MKRKNEIAVFIIEDMDLAKIISDKYFGEGLTYMSVFPADKRNELIKYIECGEK